MFNFISKLSLNYTRRLLLDVGGQFSTRTIILRHFRKEEATLKYRGIVFFYYIIII